MSKLAIHGGKPVRSKPLIPAKFSKMRYGKEEIRLLTEVIKSGNLNRVAGTKAKLLESKFEEYFGVKHAVVSSSGTAAIHIALASIGINPGDEVITTPITDMGTIIPILFQNAIPVFCDVDPRTINVTGDDIERRITKKTKAIIAVHYGGCPCEMDKIMKVAKKHNLYVIEDCAQSWLAEYGGKKAGTIGDIGCFSLNTYKHISCGDGGVTITNSRKLAGRQALFADKGWNRKSRMREHPFLGINYRMTELQAAVALAQLKKLKKIVASRRKMASLLNSMIKDVPGIIVPHVPEGAKHSYWLYILKIDKDILKVSEEHFGKALSSEGIPNSISRHSRPVYFYDVLKLQKTFGSSHHPFDYHRKNVKYKKGLCPKAEDVLREMIVITISEFFCRKDVEDIAKAIEKVAGYYSKK